jgi:acetylcholinesterase
LLIIQDDTDEGTGFVPNASSPDDITEFFLDNFPSLSPDDTKAIQEHYPLISPLPQHEPYFPSAAGAYGDATFTSPGINISSSIASHLSPDSVWSYRYNVQDQRLIDLGLGVPHTFETPAIFGVDNTGEDADSSYRTYNKDIVPVVMNYWISFVRSLDPNIYKHKEAPTWESWGSAGGQRLVLETNRSRMEDLPAEEVERAKFWRDLGDVMRH